MKNLLYICLAFVLFSCNQSMQRQELLKQAWEGRSIYYPVDSVFESFGENYVRKYELKRTEYAIVTYMDSECCQSADTLRLEGWKDFLRELQVRASGEVTCLFFLHPENRGELVSLLKEEDFKFPVCIDEDNLFYKLNRFPREEHFHTFLVDKNRRVLAIGNPAEDISVKELYFSILFRQEGIEGKEEV